VETEQGMGFSELLTYLEDPIRVTGNTDRIIRSLHCDSRTVAADGLFFALRGTAVDGHEFLDQAVRAGAVALVVEDDRHLPAGVAAVTVRDARLAMSRMAAAYYRQPTNGIPLVGITGTNGKTTTTYLVESILEKAGIPAAVLGTIEYRLAGTSLPSSHTTPESIDLQQTLRQLVDLGARGVVMEVSSHALEQRRVDGCSFDVGIFTNLTRDHLDYHHDMQSYLASKKRLFSELLQPDSTKPQRRAVVNCDDPVGGEIAQAAACPVITYGLAVDAMVTARDVHYSTEGISGLLRTPEGDGVFTSRLLGRFNLYNILSAVAAGIALGIPLPTIRAGIADHVRVAGRMERVENKSGITVLVDYAHTGDALENVLKTVQDIAKGRIITVFGCGGDRDRGKRPIMGEIAGRYSYLSILTSDNPRTEQPAMIIAQVRDGITPLGLQEYQLGELAGDIREPGFITVESRREAINVAIAVAQPADIVLIAGKGHETYQIIGAERLHFDDREEALEALRKREGLV
jgi:UDP-N-acetylmuramoyl-L-alanyl-D-glutamate--2,6-diaminopimelate ligase